MTAIFLMSPEMRVKCFAQPSVIFLRGRKIKGVSLTFEIRWEFPYRLRSEELGNNRVDQSETAQGLENSRRDQLSAVKIPFIS